LNVIEKIINICGALPKDFVKIQPTGSSYIFSNDPNFLAINLNNFKGTFATVNSLQECFYYVELGFGVNVFTIYDLIRYLFVVAFICILLFILNLKKTNLLSFFKQVNYSAYKKNINFVLFLILLFIEIFVVVKYAMNKSVSLRPFIDEYVSLTSSYYFFTDLDFNAGGFLGGAHSKYLTSGPVSAIGAVIGWIFTQNFIVVRISNYFWIVIINFILLLIISKHKKINYMHSLLFTLSMFFLVPWWQGMLYSLGEFASTIIFCNAIFLFTRSRNLSLSLFGISIVLGKLLTLIPFAGFYLIIFFKEKSLKNVLKDISFFFLPLIPWFLLINLRYAQGNLQDFFQDTLNFILKDSEASGLSIFSQFSLQNIKASILGSEYQYWNQYEKLRLSIVPLITTILIFRNRVSLNKSFGPIALPLISSITLHIIWFWLFSPLKWIRYSQHYMIVVVITLFYLLLFNIYTKKLDFLVGCLAIGLLFDNSESNFILLFALLIISVFLYKGQHWKNISKIILVSIIIFDLFSAISLYESNTLPKMTIDSCIEELISDDCRNDYLEYSK